MSLYLSRLMLNSRSRQVQSEVRQPYEMHRTLSKGFANLSKDEFQAARILFRLEEVNGQWQVLVQSKIEPHWNALQAIPQYLDSTKPPATKPWTPQFETGQRLRFRLLANPTYRRSAEGPQRKAAGNAPRRGLFREAERLDWLQNQANRHGFALETKEMIWQGTSEKPFCFRGRSYSQDFALIAPMVTLLDLNDGRRFSLPRKNGAPAQNTFSAAQFDGVLTITNPDEFHRAVIDGMGSGRGLGFGLVSVARA